MESRRTTYENRNWLNARQIGFIPLRRRTAKLLEPITARPKSG